MYVLSIELDAEMIRKAHDRRIITWFMGTVSIIVQSVKTNRKIECMIKIQSQYIILCLESKIKFPRGIDI